MRHMMDGAERRARPESGARGSGRRAGTVEAIGTGSTAANSLNRAGILGIILRIRICRELLLAVPHARIDARGGQKLAVSPAFGNTATLQHQNLVGVHDCRQSMRHHDYGVLAGE